MDSETKESDNSDFAASNAKRTGKPVGNLASLTSEDHNEVNESALRNGNVTIRITPEGDQELEDMLNKDYKEDELENTHETAFSSTLKEASSLFNAASPSTPGDRTTETIIPAGQRSASATFLPAKPTTALSYVETTALAVPAISVTASHSLNDRRRLSISSAQSPSPAIMTEHTSEVATLLSEVLDADNEGIRFPTIMSHVSTTVDDAPLSSSSSAMSFYDTGYGSTSDSNVNESEEAGADAEHKELEDFLSKKKQYFILSSAGKPIYSMHGADELITGFMGIFQAIVSYFDLSKTNDPSAPASATASTATAASTATGEGSAVASSDKRAGREQLKSVKAGNTLFVFSVEDPLILIAVDKLGQSEYQLRAQLDVLYAQILSTLTKSQLAKVFQGRNNYDLRQLLGGTEVFLSALTREMSFGSPGILLGSLECLRLRKATRSRINNILIERRTKSLLYGMIVADSRLVSVIRPRRHSLHPPDLHLVFSMLFNTTSFSKGGEHWVPICLPKFNSTGFLYAYIYFFVPEVALVLISPDKNSFFEMREGKEQILADLEQQDLITPITQSLHKGRFKSIDIPVPLVRHFLYKSKPNVQFLMPSFETHYYDTYERHKLMVLYHQLHGAVHTRQGHLKVYHTTRPNLTALSWVTPSFEIYCITGTTTKEAISQSVKAIVSWIKHNEERLFVIGGAVF